MTDTLLELTLDELQEYTQHDLVTRVFGKLDPTSDAYRELENRVIADAKIYEPAVAYEGKQLIAGNKRRQIALDHAAEFPDWRFKVRVFTGTLQEALTFAVVSNTVHTTITKNERAIAGARLYELQKELFRQEISFPRIASQVGVGSSLVQDAHAILTSGNQDCIDAISHKSKPVSVIALAEIISKFPDKQEIWSKAANNPEDRKKILATLKDGKNLKKQAEIAAKIRNASNEAAAKGEGINYGVVMIAPPPGVSLDDVRSLVVPAAEDCAVFLWAETHEIAAKIEILEGWGLTYKQLYVWGKSKTEAEFLLFASKGKLEAVDNMSTLQSASSKNGKPPIFKDGIAKMFNVPRYDMFGTGKDGQDNWWYGNSIVEDTVIPITRTPGKVKVQRKV